MINIIAGTHICTVINKKYLPTQKLNAMKKLLLTFALIISAIVWGFAQNPNDMLISGYVYNENGGAVSGWTVCVYADTSNGQPFSYSECTTTNANGYYIFNIPGGSQIGPNISFVVYTWNCMQIYMDTVIQNMQGTVNSATADFVTCTQNTGNCDAQFTWSTVPGIVSVQFNVIEDPNNINSYFWNFGDGTSGTGPNPTHTFTGTGPYYVCLTVSNNFLGCTATWCDSVYPTSSGTGCQGWFTTSQVNNSPLTVQFTGGSNSNVTSWFWDFGDGTYGQGQNPTHTYQDSGLYVVCLTINNCNSAFCDTIYVGQNEPPNCSASFTWSQVGNPNGIMGYQFTFTGISPSLAMNILWDFGDGTTSTQINPIHYYTTSGPFTVCVTISNNVCSDTYCDIVGVNTGDCQANFAYYDSSGTFYFQNLSSGNIGFWLWDFGDGTTSNQQYPTHQYTSGGTYTVCLTVGSLNNTCADTYCQTITVSNNNPCQVWFQYYQTNTGVVFNAYNNNQFNTVYTWSFGDGTGGQGQTITHQFPGPGTYTVCVSMLAPSTGCQSTYCLNITIGSNTQNYCVSGRINLGTPNLLADVAIVYLITYDPNTNLLVALQATVTDPASGQYSFCQVPAGQYLIKAALTQNSAYYWNFLPTYYGNSLFWNYAQQVNVSGNTNGVDIWLIAGANPGGPGFIGGDVTQGANKTSGPGDPLAEIQVMLLDMNNYPLAYVYSDAEGKFEFDGIPYGTYKVWAEVPGLLTTPAIVTISANEPNIDGIGIIVTSSEVTTGISSPLEAAKLQFGNIFPNPMKEDAFISISSEMNLQLNFAVYDVTGRMAENRLVNIPAGKTQVAIETGSLTPGVYTLNIQSADGSLRISRKLVKTE